MCHRGGFNDGNVINTDARCHRFVPLVHIKRNYTDASESREPCRVELHITVFNTSACLAVKTELLRPGEQPNARCSASCIKRMGEITNIFLSLMYLFGRCYCYSCIITCEIPQSIINDYHLRQHLAKYIVTMSRRLFLGFSAHRRSAFVVSAAVASFFGLGYFLEAPTRRRVLAQATDKNVSKYQSKERDYPIITPPNVAPPPNSSAQPNQVASTRPAPTSGEQKPTTPVEVEDAVLTFAPDVPPPIKRRYPATVNVELVTDSGISPLTNEYRYEFWRFNGRCPGPFIRVRVGDTLKLKITNMDKTLAVHNIDFHAVSGPGGGSSVTNVEYGQFKEATFKMLYPGLFVYHCAAAPIALHIANGMYGLLLVEPEEGLEPVDREYYVMQSEFYLEESENRADRFANVSFPQGLKEDADVVVFNGREGSLTGGNTLRANVGEKVRIFFGNAGPNLISSFHIIGTLFDRAYRDGDLTSPPAKNLQTALTAPGSACLVEVTPLVPGNYTFLDHSIFRIEKGAVGYLSVIGEPDESIYSSPMPPQACVGCKLHP